MIGPLFGPTQLAATFAELGTSGVPILGETEQQLLQQILVAVANRSGGGGGGTGTVTDVSAVGSDGIEVSVTNPTTTPEITIKGTGPLTIVEQNTLEYILELTDAGRLITLGDAGSTDLVVPPNTDVAFPIGTQILFVQSSTGPVTIVPGSGVTVNSFGGALVTAGPYAGATLIKIDTNTWIAQGNLIT